MLIQARVKNIQDDFLDLGCLDQQGCKNCSAFFCSGKKERQSDFRAVNPKGLILKPDDLVEVELSTGSSLLSSVLLFAFPLFCGLVIFLLFSALLKLPAVLNALFSLGGIGGGLTLAWLFFRWRGKKDYPIILNRLDS